MILLGWAGCSWEGSEDGHPRKPGLGGISLGGCRQPPHTAHGTHFSCACWGVPPFRSPGLFRDGGGGGSGKGLLVSAFPPPPGLIQALRAPQLMLQLAMFHFEVGLTVKFWK